MQVKNLMTGVAIALAAVATQAQTYGEIGVTAVTYEESVLGVNLKSSPQALRAVIGYELNENVAIEGLVGFGMSDDGVKVAGTTVAGAKFEVDNVVGLYVKGKTQLADGFEAFARAGIARAKGTASYLGVSESASESGFSYGFGVSYAFDKSTSLNFDYMSYLDKNSSKATGFTLGLGFKF